MRLKTFSVFSRERAVHTKYSSHRLQYMITMTCTCTNKNSFIIALWHLPCLALLHRSFQPVHLFPSTHSRQHTSHNTFVMNNQDLKPQLWAIIPEGCVKTAINPSLTRRPSHGNLSITRVHWSESMSCIDTQHCGFSSWPSDSTDRVQWMKLISDDATADAIFSTCAPLQCLPNDTYVLTC